MRGTCDVCDVTVMRGTCERHVCDVTSHERHEYDVSDVMASPRSVFTVIWTRVFNHSTVTMDTCDVMGHGITLMISW